MSLERSVLIVKKGEINAIVEQLDSQNFILLDEITREIMIEESRDLAALFPGFDAKGKVTALALETFGAIELLSRFASELNDAVAPSTTEHAAFLLQLFFPKPFAIEQTYAMIKPDLVSLNVVDEISDEIKRSGFQIIASRQFQFSNVQAEQFYAELKEVVNPKTKMPVFPPLIDFMTSGPVIGLILAKPKAIRSWRVLIGPTDPAVAKISKAHSLRAKYGGGLPNNGFHGSDKTESVIRECKIVFPNYASTTITKDQVAEYLNGNSEKGTLASVLVDGLTELCRKKPIGLDAVSFLADYLERNNPRKPRIEEPIE